MAAVIVISLILLSAPAVHILFHYFHIEGRLY